jgi:hypothetical protein
MPESAHPLPGWESLPEAPLDGRNWTLDFAAKMLEIPEKDLRDLVRITELKPSGVLNMRTFRTSGRTPRAYPAEKLIMITEALSDLREDLDFPG